MDILELVICASISKLFDIISELCNLSFCHLYIYLTAVVG